MFWTDFNLKLFAQNLEYNIIDSWNKRTLSITHFIVKVQLGTNRCHPCPVNWLHKVIQLLITMIAFCTVLCKNLRLKFPLEKLSSTFLHNIFWSITTFVPIFNETYSLIVATGFIGLQFILNGLMWRHSIDSSSMGKSETIRPIIHICCTQLVTFNSLPNPYFSHFTYPPFSPTSSLSFLFFLAPFGFPRFLSSFFSYLYVSFALLTPFSTVPRDKLFSDVMQIFKEALNWVRIVLRRWLKVGKSPSGWWVLHTTNTRSFISCCTRLWTPVSPEQYSKKHCKELWKANRMLVKAINLRWGQLSSSNT